MNLSKIILFLQISLITVFHIHPNHEFGSCQQLHSELLKHINIEDPSLDQQKLITACQLINRYGLNAPTKDAVWQAITSVEIISEILPRLHKTHTTFGYIALAQQCAEMSSDIAELQRKTDLIRYFDSHSNAFSKLNFIIKESSLAEEMFLNLCKNHNQEEQSNQDKANKKLYYTCFSSLNESSLALGFWTRLNQLHTAAWCTIPTLIGSNMHKEMPHIEKSFEKYLTQLIYLDIKDNLSQAESTAVLTKIDALHEFLEKNPTFAQKAYQDLVSHVKSIAPSEQSDIEKLILTTGPSEALSIIPSLWQESKLEVVKYVNVFTAYLTKHFVINGVQNTPNFYTAAAKKIKATAKDQYQRNPLYNEAKASLISNGWDENKTTTKLRAGAEAGLIYSAIAAYASLYPYLLYKRYQSTKELFDLVAEKQKELVQVSHLIRSLKRINAIFKQNPDLALLVPAHKKLAALFNSLSKKTSSDLKALIEACLSSSFCSESYYLSQQGKILATHHLFMRIKHELIPYLQAYGMIDAHLSTYKLYAELKDHPNARICIPEFIEHEKPKLIAQDFWHPLINPIAVVTNSLSLGTSELTANLIITGPNAGGKTTSLMALIINIIMAQSYGITTASSLSLTPFTKIHSYLDITTSLIDGESLFKAEVNRSKKLKESILSCSGKEKAFTIIDELFSGTNPDVASTVGLKFAELLGNISHSMSIITTHFPKITEIEEQSGRFQNYKVADAHIAQDGAITYPFKLELGKSTQNIAQHMLEQEGII